MSVVRDIYDDGKPGTTKGTVNKRVIVSEVLRGEKFREALITGCHIRGDEDEFILSLNFFAFSDFKSGVTQRFKVFHIKRFNPGQGRRKGRDILNELMKTSILSLGIDKDPFLIIEHPSSKEMSLGKIVNERPKPNALNDSRNSNLRSFHISHINFLLIQLQ
jgi:hypothetical protein